jgi:hypothetical protein
MADEHDEIQEAQEYVTLVDRTGGPGEFMFGGRPRVFKPRVHGADSTTREARLTVPLEIARWVLTNERQHVWTTDGVFVPRFTIKEGPEELLNELGEEAFDTSPITIDTSRAEGWNTDTADRGATRTVPLRRQASDFAHQGGALAGTFSGKER